MSNSSWKSQLDRIARYASRFDRLVQQHCQPFDRDAHEFVDDIYASLVVCHSLKDWVKNDSTLRISPKQIETFVTNSPILAVCADVANGHKHLVCDPRRTGKEKFRSNAKPDLTYSIIVEYEGESTDEDLQVEFRRASDIQATSPEDANRVKSRWLESGLDPSRLFIQVWVDIEHGKEEVVYDWGQADLLWHVHELWTDFVRDRTNA